MIVCTHAKASATWKVILSKSLQAKGRFGTTPSIPEFSISMHVCIRQRHSHINNGLDTPFYPAYAKRISVLLRIILFDCAMGTYVQGKGFFSANIFQISKRLVGRGANQLKKKEEKKTVMRQEVPASDQRTLHWYSWFERANELRRKKQVPWFKHGAE